MKPGPRPKPTALKIAKGEKKNRINFDEPKFAAEDDKTPPPELNDLAVKEWARLFPELTKSGALRITDRQTFAAYCYAYSMWSSSTQTINNWPPLKYKVKGKLMVIASCFLTPKGTVQRIPAVKDAMDWGEKMTRIARELGLTPSSRSGIMGIDPGKNKKSDLLAKLMGGDLNATE